MLKSICVFHREILRFILYIYWHNFVYLEQCVLWDVLLNVLEFQIHVFCGLRQQGRLTLKQGVVWRPLAPGILILSCGMPAPIECLQLTHAYCSISGQKSRWFLMSFSTNLSLLMCGDVNIFYTINCGNYGGSCYHVWFNKTRYSLPISKHLLRPPLDILSTCGVT